MYGIKRNIKRTPQVKKSAKTVEPMVNREPHQIKNNNQSFVLKSKGFSKYKFPNFDDVPAGYYISRVMEIHHSKTAKGEPAIEIFYKLEPAWQCQKRINKKLPPDYDEKFYYIKQKHAEDKDPYNDFVDAMSLALYGVVGKKFDISEAIGVEEYVGLSYQGNNTIGGFDMRKPIFFEDIVECIEDSEENNPDFDEELNVNSNNDINLPLENTTNDKEDALELEDEEDYIDDFDWD